MWRCGPVVRALRVSRPELRSLSGKNSVVAFRPAPVHLAPTPTLSLLPSRSYRKHRGPISTLRLPKHVTKTTSVYDHINSQVLGGVIAPPPNFETLKRFPPTVNVRHDKPERLKLPREDLLREFYERNPLMKLEPIDFTDDHVSLAEKFIAAQEEYMLEGMEQEDAYNRCIERFNTEMLAVETYLRGLQTEGAKLTDKTLLSVYFRRIGSTRELKEAKTISAGARKGTLPSDWENEMYESVDIPSVDPERRAEENAEIKEFNAAWQAQKLWQQAVEQEQAGLPSASEQGLGGQNREDRAFAAGDRLSMTAELVARQHKDERQRVFLFNQLGNARGALLSSLPLSLSMEFRELEDDREMVAQAYRFTAPGFTKMAYELCDLLDETYEFRSAFLMGNEIDLATQETNLPDDGDNANDDHSFADISEAYKASVRAQAVKPQATESSGASPVTGASPSPIAAALANAGPEVEVPKLDESTLKTESRRNLDEFVSFPLLMSKLMEGNLTDEDLNLSAEELAALGDDGKLLLARIQSGDIKHPLDIFSESERQQLAQMSRDGDFSPEKLAAIAGASTEEFQFSLDHLQDTIKIGQIYERDPTRGAALFLNKPTVDEFRNHLQEMKTMEEQAEALRPIIVAFERARHDYAVLLGQEGKTDGVPLPELFQERLAAGHARPSDVDTYHATDFTKTLDAFLTREGLAASRRKQEEDEEVPMRPVPKKLRPVVALAEERKYFNDLRLQRKQQYFDMLPEKAAELEQAAIERQEQMAKNFLSRSK